MQFSASLLFLLANAVFGLAAPLVAGQAADSKLEQRQNECVERGFSCSSSSQCCSGYCQEILFAGSFCA
jgi:hypothetical protein